MKTGLLNMVSLRTWDINEHQRNIPDDNDTDMIDNDNGNDSVRNSGSGRGSTGELQ